MNMFLSFRLVLVMLKQERKHDEQQVLEESKKNCFNFIDINNGIIRDNDQSSSQLQLNVGS